MLAVFEWNLDRVIVESGVVELLGLTFGPIKFRWYGLIFLLTILGGYFFWWRQTRRGKYPEPVVQGFFMWGVLGTLVGARLGHCFFYNAAFYLANPAKILMFWHGGLASHGATLGLAITVSLFALYHRRPIIEFTDRFAMSAAVGAAGIRLGNFLNSEIVGRESDVPWAVKFLQYESPALARHPSQLYEFAMGLTVLGLLILADRRAGKEKRPLGLMTGLFLTLYFAGRFGVEFFKEHHIESFRGGLTMGQYLSIIPFCLGVVLLIWCKRHNAPAPALASTPPAAPSRDKAGPNTRKRRKRKRTN